MEDENATNQRAGQDVESCGACCCRQVLFVAKLVLTLVCFVYILYLIGLLAYLKNDANYLFLGFLPMFYYLILPCTRICCKIYTSCPKAIFYILGGMTLYAPSACVVYFLMFGGFTMLIRLTYYHHQPEDFIGPQFIIASLQVSIVLIFLNIFLQNEGKLERLKKYKDTISRMLLDFFDIFSMVELLSADESAGVGTFVTEFSPIEQAIQAFCSLSFFIFLPLLGLEKEGNYVVDDDDKKVRTMVILRSFVYQNIPFLVIRIFVWVQFKIIYWNSLGFLLKNLTVIVIQLLELCEMCCSSNNAQRGQLQSGSTTGVLNPAFPPS